MTRTELLLTGAAEECLEVAQRLTKALRFGLDEIQPGQDLRNRERVRLEFADLMGILQMIEDGSMSKVSLKELQDKQVKVSKYLAYSQVCGVLKE